MKRYIRSSNITGVTLKDILDCVHDNDTVSIRTGGGFAIFDGEVRRMKTHPPIKKIMKPHLNDPVTMIRPYNSTLVIWLTDAVED